MRSRSSPLLGLGMTLACLMSADAQDHRLAGASVDASSTWDTLVADVTIRHRRLDREGKPIGPDQAPVRYRWERSHGPSGWKTTLTFAARPAPERPQDARFELARLEDDGDGTPARAYNRRGELMALPSPDALGLKSSRHLLPESAAASREGGRPLGGGDREWVENLVAPAGGAASRRQALKHRFGAHTGKVRGLHRFVRTSDEGTEEVLADPDSALPVEMNVARDGRLVWHGRFAYVRDRRGAYLRRAMHVEQVVSDEGERLATDLDLANVRFERRQP